MDFEELDEDEKARLKRMCSLSTESSVNQPYINTRVKPLIDNQQEEEATVRLIYRDKQNIEETINILEKKGIHLTFSKIETILKKSWFN